MIYGNRFLVTESKEDRINKYKDLLDKALELTEVQYKWLEIEDKCFEKIYPIYMNINEKNAESNYKEIKRIVDQNISQRNRIYNFEDYKNDRSKLHSKLYSSLHLLFKELPSLKNEELIKLKTDFKNKLSKISKDSDKYYNKYKEYMEKLDESKIYKSIVKKSFQIQDTVPYAYEKYDNPDGGPADLSLDFIRDSIRLINSDIKFYNDSFITLNKSK